MPIEFNKKPGLVIYLTVGDPDLATTRDVALAAIDAGAEVLELGVPFSDPLADGPVIQRASERAVANGTRLQDVLTLVAELRAMRPSAGLIIFSYYNPVLRFGLERFCAQASACGVDGVLVIDMIVEEAAEYLNHLHHNGLKPIFLAAPTSSDHRLKMIAEVSDGFRLRHLACRYHRGPAKPGLRCAPPGRAFAPFYPAADCCRLRHLYFGTRSRCRRVRRCGRHWERHRCPD